MKLLILLLMCVTTIHINAKCSEKKEKCTETHHELYIECLQRNKRSNDDCDSSCEGPNCMSLCKECDCSSCYSCNQCESCCSSCCHVTSQCTNSHCCHRKCNAECRSNSCRTSCRKICNGNVSKTSNDIPQIIPQDIPSKTDLKDHNITTVIHLHNTVNTTTIIEAPELLPNANVNNISINITTNAWRNSSDCCTVIGSRQCFPSPKFPFTECLYPKSKQCGDFCKSPVMHVEPKQVCEPKTPNSPPKCNHKPMFIPQPQPRCVYEPQWPYVSCGAQYQQSYCEGCYSHYFDQTSRSYERCSPSCYDDGYGVGPYYRQGPFYRPGYSHVPSCYQLFDCNPNWQFGHPGFGIVDFWRQMMLYNIFTLFPSISHVDYNVLDENNITVTPDNNNNNDVKGSNGNKSKKNK